MLTLVLMPGMDGTGELSSEFVAVLPSSLEVAIVRYPIDQILSYAELESIVRAVCPASEPFILLAESFSTPLAITIAAGHPANLVGIGLCAGFASSPVAGWRRFLGSMLAPLAFHIRVPRFVVKLWLAGPEESASLVSDARRAISSVQPRVLAERLRAVLSCDVRADLNKVDVPILYLQAQGDCLLGGSCLEEIRLIKPKVKVVSIQGPHLLLQRQPQLAAEAVVDFARSCCPPPIA